MVAASLALIPTYVGDDVYIHCTYIRNIVEEGRIAYNTQVPTYGSTSLAWVLIGSLLSLFTHEAPTTLRVAGAILFALNSLLVYRFLIKRFSLPSWQIFLFYAVYMSNAVVFRWMLTGMETNLVLLLTIALLLWYKPEKPVVAAFVCFLAHLVRPEFLLLPVGHVIVLFLQRKQYGKHLLRFVLILAALYFVWFSVAIWYFGSPLPLTSIKAGNGADIDSLIRFIKVVIGMYPVEILLIGILVAQAGSLTRLYGTLSTTEKILVLFAILLLTSYAIRGTNIISRYLTAIHLPLVLIFIILVAERIRSRWLPYLVAVTVLVHTAMFLKIHYPAAEEFVAGFQTTYTKIGKMLATTSSHDTGSIMVSDIGIVGFYSHRPIIDLGGLTSKHIYEDTSTSPSILADKYRPKYYVVRSLPENATEAIAGFKEQSRNIEDVDILLREEIAHLGVLDQHGWIIQVLELSFKPAGQSHL